MNTFYSKLVIALLSSFILIGLFLIWLAQQLTQEYQNEVEQKLHLHLAEQVVSSNQLLKHGKINTLILQNVFHRMMILGPSFEFYVLDT
ncbi:MAG: sensor histidine kinase, partial [Methylococcales bacterium]|nr:sensor histidine kinase [Methylococcales bacterium]